MSTTQQTNKAQQAQSTAVAVQPTAKELQAKQQEISDSVLERVNAMQQAGELVLPEGYNAGNAVRFAWLAMQEIKDRNGKPALEVCTKTSIANCLLQMIIQGQSIGKKQCYFIVTANQLTYFEDYRGKLMRAKRDTDIKDVNAQVIYEGDEFVYTIDELGQYQLVKHETKLENMNIAKIKAAYAVVIRKDGTRYIEIMNMDMIRASWQQGAAKGNSMAHTKFTDQMCKKTVISRACKVALGSSTDEMEEKDPAHLERELAQKAGAPADEEFEELQEAAVVVDTETGEVKQQPAAPAPAPAPANNGGSCPL